MPSRDDDASPDRPPELDRLPPSIDPGDLLEERVVRALRDRGVLRPERHTGGGSRRRAAPAPAWLVAAAAAALALFLGGYAMGQHHGTAAAADLLTAVHDADARERAALVQRTGSLWVSALTSLADAAVASGDSAMVDPGREAALSGLRAAARELARLEPDDARVARVVEALAGGTDRTGASSDRTIFWF